MAHSSQTPAGVPDEEDVGEARAWFTEMLRRGLIDREGDVVYGDARDVAHVLKHNLPPPWIVHTIEAPDELWQHPDGPQKKTYVRTFIYGHGTVCHVVAVVGRLAGVWRIRTAFDLWPAADWTKLASVRRWPV